MRRFTHILHFVSFAALVLLLSCEEDHVKSDYLTAAIMSNDWAADPDSSLTLIYFDELSPLYAYWDGNGLLAGKPTRLTLYFAIPAGIVIPIEYALFDSTPYWHASNDLAIKFGFANAQVEIAGSDSIATYKTRLRTGRLSIEKYHYDIDYDKNRLEMIISGSFDMVMINVHNQNDSLVVSNGRYQIVYKER